jgi:hypothetical protein
LSSWGSSRRPASPEKPCGRPPPPRPRQNKIFTVDQSQEFFTSASTGVVRSVAHLCQYIQQRCASLDCVLEATVMHQRRHLHDARVGHCMPASARLAGVARDECDPRALIRAAPAPLHISKRRPRRRAVVRLGVRHQENVPAAHVGPPALGFEPLPLGNTRSNPPNSRLFAEDSVACLLSRLHACILHPTQHLCLKPPRCPAGDALYLGGRLLAGTGKSNMQWVPCNV